MKIQKTYKVITENLPEQQAVLSVVPESPWFELDGKVIFLVGEASIEKVRKLERGE
jgi:hypothetical protein